MESSGNAFVDSRRTDAIEYCFRMKDGRLLEDLKKARHCLDEAIAVMEQTEPGAEDYSRPFSRDDNAARYLKEPA
jgi:hypothetical protein